MTDRRPVPRPVVIGSPGERVRSRWSQALRGIYAVHEVAERATLQQSLLALKPSVLLVDLALLKAGLKDVTTIQRLSPSTKIILLTRTPDKKEAVLALKAGAKGYQHTALDHSLVQKAVEVVQKGEIWIERNIVSHLITELVALTQRLWKSVPPRVSFGLDRLTPREREIAELIGSGASNKEIAGQLNISVKTVKAHLTTIFRKLGLSDRLRLALSIAEHRRLPR